jgi:Xaa-Pro dipeptidase
MIDAAIHNPNQVQYINQTILQRFRGTGGCRLEDDILITQDGCENLSWEAPSTVDDIETLTCD